MVLINNFNDGIPWNLIHLVQGIGIYCHLIITFIQSISIWCMDFLNTVMTNLQVLRQHQIPLFICKIGFMYNCSRIGSYLLYIFPIIQIIDLKFRIFCQNRLFRLIILLYDFQLSFKLIIQKDSPYLRCVRLMLCDTHDKIVYRSIIMRCSCLTDKISAIWQWDTAGITFFIRKYLSCPVFTNHYRNCRSKIITSIFLCIEAAYQICSKSRPFKKICVCLAVISCFDKLERLLFHLFRGSTASLHRCHKVPLITAGQVILWFICQIPDRRCDLFHIIIAKIKVLHKCCTIFICSQCCYFFSGFINHSSSPIRMYDVITGIQTVNRFFQCCISLWCVRIGFLIFLLQWNLRIDTFVGKRMGKSYHRLFVVGIIKPEGIHISGISQIPFRSLFFFYLISESNRKVCSKCCSSIFSCHRLFDQCTLFDDDRAIPCSNITACIHSKDTAIQRIPCILIQLLYSYLCFLSVIGKSCFWENHLYILSGIGQCNFLFFSGIIKILRCLCFTHKVSSKMQVFKNHCTIRICSQVSVYQITLLVNLSTVCGINILSGINIIDSSFLSTVLIPECHSGVCHIRSSQNLSLFINRQFSQLFLIGNGCCCCLICHQLYIISSGIDTVSFRSCNLF